MIAKSMYRVAEHTEDPNERISQQTLANIDFYARNPDLIPERLEMLEEEWDIERALEFSSTTLTLWGLLKATMGQKRGILIGLVAQGFFLQHVLQGWCPPLPLLRRFGFRTQAEIEEERIALLALDRAKRSRRGDRSGNGSGGSPRRVPISSARSDNEGDQT